MCSSESVSRPTSSARRCTTSDDKSDRHLALRPEGTARSCGPSSSITRRRRGRRSTSRPNFRYERPQAGRYRQHHQLGAEAIGTDDPDLDVEIIALARRRVPRRSGCGRCDAPAQLDRRRRRPPRVHRALRAHSRPHADALSEQSQVTLERTRCACSTRSGRGRGGDRDAPRSIDYLTDEAAAHFERVQAGLDAVGVPFVIDPLLVRGLDYYRRTTFEFASDALDAAQNTIGGGGRYDGLAEQLGGPPTPGIGFGAGIERILLACDAEGVFGAPGADASTCGSIDTTGGEQALDAHARAACRRVSRGPFLRRPVDEVADEGRRSIRRPDRLIVGSRRARLVEGRPCATCGTRRARASPASKRIPRQEVIDYVKEVTVRRPVEPAHRLLRRRCAPATSGAPCRCADGSHAAASTASTSRSSTSATTRGWCSAWSTAPRPARLSTSCA